MDGTEHNRPSKNTGHVHGRVDGYLIVQLETEAQRGQAATMLVSNWWPHD